MRILFSFLLLALGLAAQDVDLDVRKLTVRGSGGTIIFGAAPEMDATGLNQALNIVGSSTVNGNIVLQPGAVATNSSVFIESGRLDQPGLIIRDASGVTVGSAFELRKNDNTVYFHIDGGSIALPGVAGAMVSAGHYPLVTLTHDLGASVNQWNNIFGKTLGSTTAPFTTGYSTVLRTEELNVAEPGSSLGTFWKIKAVVLNNELQFRDSADAQVLTLQRITNRIVFHQTLAPSGSVDIGLTGLRFNDAYLTGKVDSATSLVSSYAGFQGAADPACVAGNFRIWANSTTNVLKKCENGTISDLAPGGTAPPFVDTTAIVKGSVDATKRLLFEVDGFTTATDRTLTPQNANYTLAGINLAQTFSVRQTFSSGVSITGTDASPEVDASGLGQALNIVGSTTGNGNIVLQPGGVATNSSVFIEAGRLDQPSLIIRDASGTTVGAAFEIRKNDNTVYFHIDGGSIASPGVAGAMVSRDHYGITGSTYAIGSTANRWLTFAGVDLDLTGTAKNTGQPRVYVDNSANQSISDSVVTALSFDTELFDVGAMHSTVTNTSRITVPAAGVYVFSCNIDWVADSATGDRSARLIVNGASTRALVVAAGKVGGDGPGQSVTTILDLAANDFVECAAAQNSGAARTVQSYANGITHFAAARLW